MFYLLKFFPYCIVRLTLVYTFGIYCPPIYMLFGNSPHYTLIVLANEWSDGKKDILIA